MFGEDIARKGGVYGVTRGLQSDRRTRPRVRHPARRTNDSRPGPGRRCYRACCRSRRSSTCAYLHNAADQIRGEGATLQFFSNRQYRNPMVVRIAGYGYQKGFGGHFHNDDSIAAIRDIPGVVIASPARPDDAAAMLHTCVAARESRWCRVRLPRTDRPVPHQGPARRWRSAMAGDLSGRAGAHRCGPHLRCRCRPDHPHLRQRTVDEPAGGPSPRTGRDHRPRWSTCVGCRRCRSRTCCGRRMRPAGCSSSTRPAAPEAWGKVCWPNSSITASPARVQRVASADSFIPLGDAALQVLLSEDTIEAAAVKLVGAR